MTLKSLEAEALKLIPEQRAHLAKKLMESLDELSEEEVLQLWLEEAERRAKEIESGEVVGIPAKEAIAQARAIIKRC